MGGKYTGHQLANGPRAKRGADYLTIARFWLGNHFEVIETVYDGGGLVESISFKVRPSVWDRLEPIAEGVADMAWVVANDGRNNLKLVFTPPVEDLGWGEVARWEQADFGLTWPPFKRTFG